MKASSGIVAAMPDPSLRLAMLTALSRKPQANPRVLSGLAPSSIA